MAEPTNLTDPWERAVAAARDYQAAHTDHATVGPNPDELAALSAFSPDHLDAPLAAVDAIDLLARVGGPATMRSTGGQYYGFVNGGTHPAARAAAVLAGTWDQNAALSTMSPVSAHLDQLTGRWVVEVLGLPSTALASFCGGASVANLTGVITGRDELLARQGWSVADQGLMGAPPVAVAVGAEIHISALRSLRHAGFGAHHLIEVAVDDQGRMRPDALAAGLEHLAGDAPVLVMTQAGNVNTGAFDPFDEIITAVDEAIGPERCWVHVDGAFGLWAAAAPARRHLTAGVDRADSWATDGHKYPNTPYDCGITICADAGALRRAMSVPGAAYVAAADGEHDPMNLGLQMSQAARAVPLWAVLATEGRQGMADRVEKACAQAERLASLVVDGSEGRASLLAPVVLNQALVAFTGTPGAGADGDGAGGDDLTDAVIARIQADGRCWAGATTWQGRRAMRISVSSFATTDDDITASAEAMLDALTTVTDSTVTEATGSNPQAGGQ